jgi:hypothetical protein
MGVLAVQTQGADVADSVECEKGDFEMSSITLAEAHEHARVHPRLSSMGEMDASGGMCDVFAAAQLKARKQTTGTSLIHPA